MAKAKKRQKTEADIQSEAALEIVNADKAIEHLAASETESNNLDFRSAGAVDALRMMSSHTQMLMWVTLYKVKKRKEYKGRGVTWEQFCDRVVGIPKRTVDQKLMDIRPVIEQYEADLNNLVGFSHSQIKLIGRAVGDGDAKMDGDEIVYDGERYPLKPESKNDIMALLNHIKEDHQRRLEEADDKVADMEQRLKAKDQMAKKSREEAAELKERLERRDLDAQAEEFENADEQMKIARIEQNRLTFKGIILELRPENKKLLKDPTPRIKAEYLSALYEMREKIMIAYDAAVEMYGVPAAHGAFNQETGVNLDEVPDPEDQDGVDPENVIAIQKKAK